MSMEQVVVPIVYVYPAVQPLIAAIISQLFGISTVAAHYLIAICVMLLSPIVFIMCCKKHVRNLWTILAGCCLIITISSSSRFYPGALALLLFVIFYGIIFHNPYNPSTLRLAVLTYALLFTKQTYVVIGAGVVLYLLFVNRKCLLKYLLHLTWIGIFVLIISYCFFPAYFAESLYITQCSTHSSVKHLIA